MRAAMASSFKDRAYQHIRAKILRGGYSAGERLSEEALATEIGISRTPVREALSRLASEGLAKQLPHYGVFVRKFDREGFEELYELRILLESYAAGHAAQRRTEEQLAELDSICEKHLKVAKVYRESGISEELVEQQRLLDVQFHQLIMLAARLPQTTKVAGDLRFLTQVCGRREFTPDENLLHILGRTWREHQAIVRALRQRNSHDAQDWMSQHLKRGMKERLSAFDRQQGQQPAEANGANQLDHFRSNEWETA